MSARRTPSLEALFVASFALLGLRLGLRPIGDNSTFVHLRTGIDLVAGRGLPRHDPYSFTAAGEPWVVQSWFASLLYGSLERIAGLRAVVVLNGVLYAALAALLARLARTGVPWRTCVVAAIAVGVGAFTWSPRPLAIGLVAFASTMLVVERGRPPWWLVPIVWVWVNSHGSFILGGVWLALVIVGGRRDLLRYLAWWGVGIAASVVNPLGPRLLAFPLALLTKSANFGRVVEWRAPSFRGPLGVVSLLAVVGAFALLARSGRRMPSSDVLPAVVFVALGLASQRNLAIAGVALAPVLARALRPEAIVEERARSVNTAFVAVIAVAAAVFVVAAWRSAPLDLDGYPVAAIRRLPTDARLASTDIAGCYLILERGRDAHVFLDDRYDMYPRRVVRDYVELYDATPKAIGVLDRYRVDAVLWPRDGALATVLENRAGWRRVHRDADWAVYVRDARR